MRLLLVFACVIGRTSVLLIRLPLTRPEARHALRAEAQHRACRRICRILNLSVRHDPAPPAGTALFVSNHIGALDAFVLASAFRVAFVGKADLGSTPVVGWVCRAVGFVAVDRDQRMAASGFVDRVRQRLASGASVLAFPEGTTTTGESVLPFKTSVFEAAAGVPGVEIRPVCITYSADEADEAAFAWADTSVSLTRHAWRVLGFRRATVDVLQGEAFPADAADRRTLAARAHEAVTALRLQKSGPSAALAGIHDELTSAKVALQVP